uniref:POU class 6 homeobox 1 n=1 Tax=Ursus americanus TaxID=9643 RepID=A0A452RL90_URSAM
MDPGAGPESSLTVNEQVIVMSGHETIRVLEVGVDAQISAEEEGKGLEGVAAEGSQSRGPGEASEPAGEAGPDNPDSSAEATVKSLPGIPPSPAPALATFSQAPSQPQASQTLTPLAVQAAPQVRQGLAVWTIPTATVATLPGLTAASPTGGIFKPPLAGLQDQCCFPRGTDPDPRLPHYHSGHCQRHSQHAGDQQSDPHQRSGTGYWSTSVGRELGQRGSPSTSPGPAGPGCDTPAVAERPGPGDCNPG